MTTETVSADAKEVFKELQQQARDGRSGGEMGAAKEPIYIEGLKGLHTAMVREANDSAARQAKAALLDIEFFSGYGFLRAVDFLKPHPSGAAAVNMDKEALTTNKAPKKAASRS